jgi:phosphatidylglycerol lysyltransferase
VEYSGELWWRFALDRNAPRSLRALAGASVTALLIGLAMLLRPHHRVAVGVAGSDKLELALPVVSASPQSYANLALLGDKEFLFNEAGTAFLMYRRSGRSWVSMGDPVGPVQEWSELAWRFRELADRFGGWTVFYEVGPEQLSLYLELGLSMLKLGEEARVNLEGFSLEGGERKKLRHILNKLEKEGASFEVAPAVEPLLPELKAVSDAWLARKSTREKSFSLGCFRESYLLRFPAALVRQQGRIVAFANLWAGQCREELSLDLMRFLPEAPEGVMEYLFGRLMLWGRAQGYRWFNLGMVPLAGLADHALAPLWDRVGVLLFRHGENFYNFQGLRQFKDKFDPVWTPRYLASPGGLALPVILANVASLVSSGLKGVVAK